MGFGMIVRAVVTADRQRLVRQGGFWCTLLAFLCSLMGCGYTLLGQSATSSHTAIPLAVDVFTNRTPEPGLEARLTAALRQTVLQGHTFQLATQDMAFHRVQGIVRAIRTVALSFRADDTVLQYRVEADIRIHLLSKESPKVVLEQDMTAWAEYLVSQNRIVREEVVAREAALARLADQFASQCTALLAMFLL